MSAVHRDNTADLAPTSAPAWPTRNTTSWTAGADLGECQKLSEETAAAAATATWAALSDTMSKSAHVENGCVPGRAMYDMCKAEMPPAPSAAVACDVFELTWQYGPGEGDVRRARVCEPRVLHDMLDRFLPWSTLAAANEEVHKRVAAAAAAVTGREHKDGGVAASVHSGCRHEGEEEEEGKRGEDGVLYWKLLTGALVDDVGRADADGMRGWWARAVGDVMERVQRAFVKMTVVRDEVVAVHVIAPSCSVRELF